MNSPIVRDSVGKPGLITIGYAYEKKNDRLVALKPNLLTVLESDDFDATVMRDAVRAVFNVPNFDFLFDTFEITLKPEEEIERVLQTKIGEIEVWLAEYANRHLLD